MPRWFGLVAAASLLASAGPVQAWEAHSSTHFTVRWADQAQAKEVHDLLRLLERVHADLAPIFEYTPTRPCQVTLYSSTATFIQATGKPGWMAAVATRDGLDLQPPRLLRGRGILTQTVRHEYGHVIVHEITRGRAPIWLHEGITLTISGEGPRLQRRAASTPALSLEALEAALQAPQPRMHLEQLYIQAFTAVRGLLDQGGWVRMREFLRTLGDATPIRDALKSIYGPDRIRSAGLLTRSGAK
jgi:hypothetical protein